MINILIFGENSYIGTSVLNWLSRSSDFNIKTVDSMSNDWEKMDFSNYDCIYDVAGIAHDTGNKKDADLYYRVNRDLTIKVAEKAKKEGVKQFIYMSSMLVYNGQKNRIITSETKPKVKGYYGDSKLQADLFLQTMNSDFFRVAIVRPPMIYGPKCKGNFPRLSKLCLRLPIFPKFKNERSMLFIDNLCEFVKLLILSGDSGIFFPQNKDYFSTSDIALLVRKHHGKVSHQTILLNWLIYLLRPLSSTINKMFGNLIYSKDMSSCFDWNYIVTDNNASIDKAETK